MSDCQEHDFWRLPPILVRWLLSAWLLAAWSAYADSFEGKVVHVTDGDTLTVLVQRKQIRVRLVEIDAPESKQHFGRRSQQSLRRRLGSD